MNNSEYSLLEAQARAFCDAAHPVSAVCNILSLIWYSDRTINWAGLYLAGPDSLYLGPFMGKPACMEIGWGKGVVGTCARNRKPMLVPDVHTFEGHIACDSDSRSEAVFPLAHGDSVLAVLDIDCLETGGISQDRFECFSRIAVILEDLLKQVAPLCPPAQPAD